MIGGATKDLKDVTDILLSLEKYRSTISDFKEGLMSQRNGAGIVAPGITGAEKVQGHLGRVPEKTESIAELMLFDSDINVYGDVNVYIPDN